MTVQQAGVAAVLAEQADDLGVDLALDDLLDDRDRLLVRHAQPHHELRLDPGLG